MSRSCMPLGLGLRLEFEGCAELHVRLVDFDDVPVRVCQENLVPASNGPLAVIGIANAQLVTATHETPDVVRAEAVVPFAIGLTNCLILKPVSTSRSAQ